MLLASDFGGNFDNRVVGGELKHLWNAVYDLCADFRTDFPRIDGAAPNNAVMEDAMFIRAFGVYGFASSGIACFFCSCFTVYYGIVVERQVTFAWIYWWSRSIGLIC